MKIAKNKTARAIAIFLIFAMIFSLAAIPIAHTQENTSVVHPYIGATPNPVGVGQQVLLHVGVIEGLASTPDGWVGLTITVEKPDGTTTTLGPYRTDSTGGTGDVFTPDEAGTYYLQTHFPAQDFTWSPFGFGSPLPMGGTVHYEARDSEKLALNVTSEPIEYYPGAPLPTEYWTRPIDSQLREWSTIAGNWPATPPNRFAPYNEGPETAHILWAKPISLGGVAGGDVGNVGIETGDAYEGYFSTAGMGAPSIILAGRLYYNQYKGGMSVGGNLEQEVVCVDLHTGEELWRRNWDNTRLSFGQELYFGSWNYQGVFDLLWVAQGGVSFFGPPTPETWDAYNAFTGRWEYSMINLPPASNLYGPNGEICRYYVDLANGWMMKWNSTLVVSSGGSFGSGYLGYTFNVSMNDWNTRPSPVPPGFGAPTTGYTNGYEWNKTIPLGLPGSVALTFLDDRLIGTNIAGGFGAMAPDPVVFWGISLKPGEEGKLLFNKSWDAPSEWISENVTLGVQGGQFGTLIASPEDKVAVIWAKELRAHYGVSLETGQLIWGPTITQNYLDAWEGTQLTTHLIAYGKLYAAGVGGTVYCWDVTNGDLLWTYVAEDPYTEYLFGNNWWLGSPFITDGKIYLGHAEHSPNQPLPRGAPFICLNATTGDLIWRANGLFRQTGWGGLAIIGDSIMATMDTYDMRIYGVGRGPSATTVTAPDIGIPFGTSVMIRGTVTDVSPGTKSDALTMRFPNGVPAISDESMSDWMLYVYKQFACPANTNGVEVTIDVLDANGNYRNIGTTTSDANGIFSFAWEPDIPGKFTIYATFAGSKAYYGSSAETAFVVDEALQPTPAPTPELAPMTDTYVLGFGTAMIVAIAIIGVLLILMLRKR